MNHYKSTATISKQVRCVGKKNTKAYPKWTCFYYSVLFLFSACLLVSIKHNLSPLWSPTGRVSHRIASFFYVRRNRDRVSAPSLGQWEQGAQTCGLVVHFRKKREKGAKGRERAPPNHLCWRLPFSPCLFFARVNKQNKSKITAMSRFLFYRAALRRQLLSSTTTTKNKWNICVYMYFFAFC